MELETEEMDFLRERVIHGARVLDRFEPGWRERINLERFAITDCMDCILGQLFGDYIDGLNNLRERLPDRDGDLAAYFGFEVDDEEVDNWNMARDQQEDEEGEPFLNVRRDDYYAALNILWREAIAGEA